MDDHAAVDALSGTGCGTALTRVASRLSGTGRLAATQADNERTNRGRGNDPAQHQPASGSRGLALDPLAFRIVPPGSRLAIACYASILGGLGECRGLPHDRGQGQSDNHGLSSIHRSNSATSRFPNRPTILKYQPALEQFGRMRRGKVSYTRLRGFRRLGNRSTQQITA